MIHITVMVILTCFTPEEVALTKFYKNETTRSIRKIAQKVGKSASTVYRVLQQLRERKTVRLNSQCRTVGRSRKISEKQGKRIIRYVHRLR